MVDIYNSLRRKKETFIPRIENQVGIYVCGMTVYDYCHIGHARVMVVFDTVVRYLRERGFKVNYVRNITDIDDKIIRRAQELGQDINELTATYISAMHEDSELLGVLAPDQEPRATHHIDEILGLIETLVENATAYVGGNGDVYYSVRQFANYGQLSGESLEQLRVGARVETDKSKRDPLDFVLWKAAKKDEPSWESPWGAGRPGWHIECSAMSMCCLGNHFDIHAGGMDLRFPHHENEIAQSEAATGEKFANLWMHNGYVQVDEEKMSKSLGNFFTIREVLAQDNVPRRMGEVIRYMILASHYRSSLNYSQQTLENAKDALTRIYRALLKVDETDIDVNISVVDSGYVEKFYIAMDDDFNSPEAIAVIFDLTRELNRALDQNNRDEIGRFSKTLWHLGEVLGLLKLSPKKFLGMDASIDDTKNQFVARGELTVADIETLILKRDQARIEKNYQEADKIRHQLGENGISIEDAAGGKTTWREA